MLKSLSIRNVVLIEKLDLDFSAGLCVFSGETGAGKSILLDSLSLLLGSRGDTGLISNGAEKLCVSAVFELRDKTNPFYELCALNELEVEDEILIKRTLNRDGKGKIFLNDQPMTLRLLRQLGSYLVEIHGQFDNQGLLDSSTHLDVLDGFGDDRDNLAKMSAAWQNYQELKTKLKQTEEAYAQNVREEENLRHWTDELEKAHVRSGEEAELNRRRTEMMHAAKITENLNAAYDALQGKNLPGFVQKAQSALARINNLTENRFADISDSLDTALIQLDEAINRIEQASSDINLNSSEADAVEERLFALKALARKHQTDIDNLPAVLADFRHRLETLEKDETNLQDLKNAVSTARKDFLTAAQTVSSNRQKTALCLDKAVMNELPPLKMERAVFKTEMTPLAENEWNAKGCDKICFTVATNPGSPQGPLSKIASGGELARFMLALKVILARKSSIETLIFDEVDAGIGGATAQAVGERLDRLANNVQVFVVTHSPQVAAFSRRHFKVSKSSVENVTTTSVCQLDDTAKKEEIARMLSGEKITDQARAAADVLIKRA